MSDLIFFSLLWLLCKTEGILALCQLEMRRLQVWRSLSAHFACVCAKSLQLCLTLWPYGLWPARLLCPWGSPGKNTGVGCHPLLQGIFPTQGSNPCFLCLLHWQTGSLPLVPAGQPQGSLYFSLIPTFYSILFRPNGKLLKSKTQAPVL